MYICNEKCKRGLESKTIDIIASDNTFICAGINLDNTREIKDDIFCHCFKSETTDTHFYLNREDATDTITVLSKALTYLNYNDIS